MDKFLRRLAWWSQAYVFSARGREDDRTRQSTYFVTATIFCGQSILSYPWERRQNFVSFFGRSHTVRPCSRIVRLILRVRTTRDERKSLNDSCAGSQQQNTVPGECRRSGGGVTKISISEWIAHLPTLTHRVSRAGAHACIPSPSSLPVRRARRIPSSHTILEEDASARVALNRLLPPCCCRPQDGGMVKICPDDDVQGLSAAPTTPWHGQGHGK